MPDSLPAKTAVDASSAADHPEGWIATAIHKLVGTLKKWRQLSVQGMTASNSTHMPQHDDPEPDEKK